MQRFISWACNATSVFLGLIFFSSGMGKLYAGHAFPGIIGPVWLEEVLVQYGLGLLGQFIGWSQVVTGFLLLTLRFRLAGAVMLVPMLANILIVTISLHWQGTPWIVGCLLGFNIALLWADRTLLLPLLTRVPAPVAGLVPPYREAGHLVWVTGLMLVLSSVLVSVFSRELAWGLCLVGLGMAWCARLADRLAA
ncbi:MAG: hypothetical protein SF053_16660 [Bacteroidia bacterium]|nr:hypothetical protein [Bacteroidia bacterium]